jgi:hypothetical protein
MVLREILAERFCSSRSRGNPRGLKRKMSNYNLRDRTIPCDFRRQPLINVVTAKGTVLRLGMYGRIFSLKPAARLDWSRWEGERKNASGRV